MILEAKYIGPHAEVIVPGFEHKKCKRGESIKIRVIDGTAIGGCWEIEKGKKEYESALEKAEKKRADGIAAQEAKRVAANQLLSDALDKNIEKNETKTKTTGKKGGDQ